uniref:Uncharacterized protein n=1 Tax=Chaetoceros debilis TaxID=122233 RepID=A0A7S3PUH4_9STRA
MCHHRRNNLLSSRNTYYRNTAEAEESTLGNIPLLPQLPLIIGEELILSTAQTSLDEFVAPPYLVVEIDDGLSTSLHSSGSSFISLADSEPRSLEVLVGGMLDLLRAIRCLLRPCIRLGMAMILGYFIFISLMDFRRSSHSTCENSTYIIRSKAFPLKPTYAKEI